MWSHWASRSSSDMRTKLRAAVILTVAALAAAGCRRLSPTSSEPAAKAGAKPAPAAADSKAAAKDAQAPAASKDATADGKPAAAKAGAPPAPAAGKDPQAAPAKAAPPVAAPVVAAVAFNHKTHATRGVTCTDCHDGAESKDEAGMPTLETCMDCHEEMEEEAPPEKKIAQFVDPATKKVKWNHFTRQADEIKFTHKAHAAKKVECTSCHGDMTQRERTGPDLFLTMDACTTCHAEKKASNECTVCHTEIGKDQAPKNHDRLWMVRHGQIVRRGSARGRDEDCSMCHTESTCIGCHRDEKPKDHTNYWRVGPGHGLSAAMDRERCATCHMADSCVACHTSNPPRSHTGGWGAPRTRHCLGCHQQPGDSLEGGGCFACHQGTPSHQLAPPKPRGHRPDWECLLCHTKLKHAVNEQSCNSCHR